MKQQIIESIKIVVITDGRFVNHFYDAQNGGHALTYGAFLRTDALHWVYNTKKEV